MVISSTQLARAQGEGGFVKVYTRHRCFKYHLPSEKVKCTL